MEKLLIFNMSSHILDMAVKPLRSRESAILLMLHTIRMFDDYEFIKEEREEKVNISINKMNRIFYSLEKKIFSMQFPFYIYDNSKKISIYHKATGIDVNPIVQSFLIKVFEELNNKDIDIETFYYLIMDFRSIDKEYSEEQIWSLILHLLRYDLGYIRYDVDHKNANGNMHPVNHFDVCLDSSATYKIGLYEGIEFDEFKDILDITTKCWHMNCV